MTERRFVGGFSEAAILPEVAPLITAARLARNNSAMFEEPPITDASRTVIRCSRNDENSADRERRTIRLREKGSAVNHFVGWKSSPRSLENLGRARNLFSGFPLLLLPHKRLLTYVAARTQRLRRTRIIRLRNFKVRATAREIQIDKYTEWSRETGERRGEKRVTVFSRGSSR